MPPWDAGGRPEDLVGHRVADRYDVVAPLGAGGMGMVFRAHQVGMDRDVALKVLAGRLTDRPDAVARFSREAKAVSRLRHPNTVRLYDFGTTVSGMPFMAMELVDGEPLRGLMTREGALPIDQALTLIDQVCASLEEAHAAGIIHRDIKPENIMLDRLTGDLTARVLDFGLARLATGDDRITQTGEVLGTPVYLAPEQARGGPTDARTDIYQLGVLLYHLLAGGPPFTAASAMALLMAHMHAPPPPLGDRRPDAPEGVQVLVARMLAKAPTERPASVTEVRLAIAAARAAEALPAKAPPAAASRRNTTPAPARKPPVSRISFAVSKASAAIAARPAITTAMAAGSRPSGLIRDRMRAIAGNRLARSSGGAANTSATRSE